PITSSTTITQEKSNLPIDSYLLRQLSFIEQKAIDKKIACVFYADGILHTLIENNFVIVGLKSLRPTYNPPSRWSLSNNLLRDEYKEYIKNNQLPNRTQQDHQIRILIADKDNWDNISILAEVLRPIVKSTLSLVYKKMIDLKNLECDIKSPIQDSVITIITERFNYMQNPIMQLAYLFDGHFYLHYHFCPTAYILTQLFQEVTPYISNFVSKSEKEIYAGLYREYGELVTRLDTNIILQEAVKELHPREWWKDVEQEIDDEANWEDSDDEVFYDSE
ncbi:18067_t:CDS:2, partial [Racocetra fulgida]